MNKTKTKPKTVTQQETGGDCHARLVRRVRVDMGYGCAEHLVVAEVMEERTVANLFGDGSHIELWVEIPGGERVWVTSWEELSTVTAGQDGDKWRDHFVLPIAPEMKRRGIGEMRIKLTEKGTAVFELLPTNASVDLTGDHSGPTSPNDVPAVG